MRDLGIAFVAALIVGGIGSCAAAEAYVKGECMRRCELSARVRFVVMEQETYAEDDDDEYDEEILCICEGEAP